MLFEDQRLLRLVYVSAVSERMTPEQLIEIATKAQKSNSRRRITGVLLHVENEFFQILEGPARAVEDVFVKVESDLRNQWVTPLLRERPFFRACSSWSVGCFDMPFDDLSSDLFFKADWEHVRERVNADSRHTFFRFLERFYDANINVKRVASI